jgi:replicative DNA helicase
LINHSEQVTGEDYRFLCGGGGLSLDYLRLVQAGGDQLRERVGNVAEGVRQLAKSENISVLALSQLSRPKDGDINSRPNLLQLKESGDVEASAHTVLLIYMPMRNDSPIGEDEVIIGKNRNGPWGRCQCSSIAAG